MANSEDRLQQVFPFMQLLPELRISIYELFFRNIVHQELSSGDVWGPNQYASMLVKINPLPHTCHAIRRESTQAFVATVNSMYRSMESEYQECKDLQARMQSLRLPCNPVRQAALACSMRTVNDFGTIVKRIEKNIARHQSNMDNIAIESKLAGICTGIQARLNDGAGVRASFQAEVKYQVGVNLTDAGVKVVIKSIASIFAPLRVSRRPTCSRRIPRFGLIKCLSTPRSRSKEQMDRTHMEDCEHCRIMEELGSLHEDRDEFVSTGEILYGVEVQMRVRVKVCECWRRLT